MSASRLVAGPISRASDVRGTGARGLRAILEEMLLDTMFDLPGRDDVIEVRVTEATVVNKTAPLLELSGKKQKKEA